jgi:hypothetical protein
MIFQELVKSVPWEVVWETHLELYPDESDRHDSYKKIYNKFCNDDPVKNSMVLEVSMYIPSEAKGDLPEDLPWASVGGHNGTLRNEDEHWSHGDIPEGYELEQYGLSFKPWNEWMGMEVSESTLKSFTNSQIISHSFWELTFNGVEEDVIEAQLDDLIERVKSVEDGTAKLISLKDAFKNGDAKYGVEIDTE